jgi:UDP-N-acetylglucosamine acyltransferase
VSGVHPTSIVGDGVRLGADVAIGPFCLVEGDVVLGDGVVLHSHAVVTGRTQIGAKTAVFPFASIGHRPQDMKYEGEPSTLSIGANCTIRENVTINPGTRGGGMRTAVGDNCLLMAGVHVAHDCQVGNNVIIANGTGLAGHIEIGDYAIIGGMVGAHQYLRIGQHAFVGAMSCLRKDVMPFSLVSGNPAYMGSINSVGLKRRGFSHEDLHTLRSAYRSLFSEEGTLQERAEAVEAEYRDSPIVGEILAFLRKHSARSYTGPRLSQDLAED